MAVRLRRYALWQPKWIWFLGYMVLQCLPVGRHRFVPLPHLHHYQSSRRWTGWTQIRQIKDICIIITSHLIQLARQSRAEDREGVRLGMVRLRSVHWFRFFLAKRNSHMQFVLFQRHLSQMVPLHRQVSVLPLCHWWLLGYQSGSRLPEFLAVLWPVILMMIIWY